jgi:hypothetical protein
MIIRGGFGGKDWLRRCLSSWFGRANSRKASLTPRFFHREQKRSEAMNQAEKIYEVSKRLPPLIQQELLDFAEYLQAKKCKEVEVGDANNQLPGSVARVLTLLASPRFSHRQPADADEVAKRINLLRDEWGSRG